MTEAEGDHRNADLAGLTEKVKQGNPKYHEKLAQQGKLFVRDRLALLLDSAEGFVEDGLLVNALAGDLPADGVVTGVGQIDGRPVAVMANDPTVKAGSWGARTVEKIIRIIELARKHEHPIIYLVDSAGARITDQVDLFPGRRGAGKIFYNQVQASGTHPADLLPVRAVGRRRRLHPRLLRRRVHGRRERLDVPRLAAHGRGGHRREGDARGDGRRAHARRGLRVRRPAWSRTTRRRSRRRGATSRTSHRACADEPARDRGPRRRRTRARSPRSFPSDESQAFDMYALIAGIDRRSVVLRGQAGLRQRADHRARRGSTAVRSASSRTSRRRRAASCSSTPPTRRRASSGCATRSTSRWSSSPTSPAS